MAAIISWMMDDVNTKLLFPLFTGTSGMYSTLFLASIKEGGVQ